MNANYKLKYVFAAFAFMLPRFCFSEVVCTIAHQMFVFALRANANCDTLIFVGIKLEEVTAAFKFDVGKIVDRIVVLFAVPSKLFAKIGVIVPIPIVTTFRECHKGSDAERPDSSSRGK